MRKFVDVFVRDRLVASYPVLLEEVDRPDDEAFITKVRQQMKMGSYSSEDLELARFLVRSMPD